MKLTNATIRFNLAKGKTFMKWKVETANNVLYLDPSEFKLVMKVCKLKNRRATADKICDGANKSVCSWIVCSELHIHQTSSEDKQIMKHRPLFYNPRVCPYWTNSNGDNLDGEEVRCVVTFGSKLNYLK